MCGGGHAGHSAGEEERRPGVAYTNARYVRDRPVTRPAQSVDAASAVIADRYATAAATAAREATRAARIVMQPRRTQNLGSLFIGRGQKAAKTGGNHEHIPHA